MEIKTVEEALEVVKQDIWLMHTIPNKLRTYEVCAIGIGVNYSWAEYAPYHLVKLLQNRHLRLLVNTL